MDTVHSSQFAATSLIEGEGGKEKREDKENLNQKGFIFILLKTFMRLAVFLAAPQAEPRLTPLCRPCPKERARQLPYVSSLTSGA